MGQGILLFTADSALKFVFFLSDLFFLLFLDLFYGLFLKSCLNCAVFLEPTVIQINLRPFLNLFRTLFQLPPFLSLFPLRISHFNPQLSPRSCLFRFDLRHRALINKLINNQHRAISFIAHSISILELSRFIVRFMTKVLFCLVGLQCRACLDIDFVLISH